MKSKEVLSAPWKEIAKTWGTQVTSPGRATQGEIALYKKGCDKVLKKKGKKHALIFGATPELRTLLNTYSDVQVVLVDINIEMILAMTELVTFDTSEEIWIRSDWLKAPLPANYFDIILGDYTYENLPFEKHKKYFENVKKLLKRDGRYVGRTAVYQEDFRPWTFEKIQNYAEKKVITRELMNQIWEEGMLFMKIPKKKRQIRVSDFFKTLSKHQNDTAYRASRMKKIIDRSKNLYPASKSWFVWTEDEFKKIIEKSFLIEDYNFASDMNMPEEHKDFSPVICLRKKV